VRGFQPAVWYSFRGGVLISRSKWPCAGTCSQLAPSVNYTSPMTTDARTHARTHTAVNKFSRVIMRLTPAVEHVTSSQVRRSICSTTTPPDLVGDYIQQHWYIPTILGKWLTLVDPIWQYLFVLWKEMVNLSALRTKWKLCKLRQRRKTTSNIQMIATALMSYHPCCRMYMYAANMSKLAYMTLWLLNTHCLSKIIRDPCGLFR